MLFLKVKIKPTNIFLQGCNKMIFCVTNFITGKNNRIRLKFSTATKLLNPLNQAAVKFMVRTIY